MLSFDEISRIPLIVKPTRNEPSSRPLEILPRDKNKTEVRLTDRNICGLTYKDITKYAWHLKGRIFNRMKLA